MSQDLGPEGVVDEQLKVCNPRYSKYLSKGIEIHREIWNQVSANVSLANTCNQDQPWVVEAGDPKIKFKDACNTLGLSEAGNTDAVQNRLSIALDPVLQYRLDILHRVPNRSKIIKATFARRRGNRPGGAEWLVLGLKLHSMNKFGYIFCRDVHDYNSGPVGSVMLLFDKRWKKRHQVAQQVGQEGKKDDGKGNGEVDGVNDGDDNREGNNGEGLELEVPTWEGEHPLHPFANGVRTTVPAKMVDAVFRDFATGVVSPRPPEMDNEITEGKKEKDPPEAFISGRMTSSLSDMVNNVLDEPGKEEKNDGGTEGDPVGASNGSVRAAGPSRLKSRLVKKECPYCHSKVFNLNRHLDDRYKMNRPGDMHDRDEIFKLRANAKRQQPPNLVPVEYLVPIETFTQI